MCGISGYFGRNTIQKESILNTLNLMKNRGPDFAEHYTKAVSSNLSVYFLHSRLAIIDLHRRSNQPFIIGDYVLIFNGEIYNYIELYIMIFRYWDSHCHPNWPIWDSIT